MTARSTARAIAIVAVAAIAGCVDVDTTMRPWEAAPDIAGPLATELGPAPVMPPPTPVVLRIGSWNVFKAERPAEVAAEIAASTTLATADLILLQEVENHPDEPASRTEQIATALGMTWFYAPARVEGDGTHGDAILSRFPITAAEVKRLPYIDMAFNPQDRIAQRVTLDLGGGRTLVVVNVHLDTRVGAVDRIRQLDPAVSDNPPEVVIGGDFNTLPWAWVDTAVPLLGTEAIVGNDQAQIIDDYLEQLGFATPLPHDADTHEFPVDMRLDALYPRELAPLAAGVADDADGSDHFAVWMDVAL